MVVEHRRGHSTTHHPRAAAATEDVTARARSVRAHNTHDGRVPLPQRAVGALYTSTRLAMPRCVARGPRPVFARTRAETQLTGPQSCRLSLTRSCRTTSRRRAAGDFAPRPPGLVVVAALQHAQDLQQAEEEVDDVEVERHRREHIVVGPHVVEHHARVVEDVPDEDEGTDGRRPSGRPRRSP